MTTRTHRFAAFALSLAMTLVIFSGVTRFSSPEHAGAVLARSAVDTAASAPV